MVSPAGPPTANRARRRGEHNRLERTAQTRAEGAGGGAAGGGSWVQCARLLGGSACRGSASGEFILPAVPDAARTAVVDRRQLTGKMKSPALEKNTIGTASPRRTKVLTLAKASSVILGRCENAVTTPNHIRSFATCILFLLGRHS